MWNIYLEVNLEINFVTGSVFGALQLTQISLNLKTSCCNIKTRGLGVNCVWLFYYFDIERNYDVLKSKSPSILLNKNTNFNKNETESKMKNPTHSFREMNLCFNSYKNPKSKVKLWWVGSREGKENVFCTVYFLRSFFKICILSQCVAY